MKRRFFQATVVSILLYGCTAWTLSKQMEKQFESNFTRILRAIVKKSWTQHPMIQQLYSHRPLIMKTIKIRRRRYMGHCWRSRDKLISNVLFWTPSLGQAKAGRTAQIYIQQLCVDTGCCPEDMPERMDDWEGWQERVNYIYSDSTTWWWW